MSSTSQVLEEKRELEGQLEGLQMANEERSKELERVRGGAPAPSTTAAAAAPTTTTIAAHPAKTPDSKSDNAAPADDDFKSNIEAEVSPGGAASDQITWAVAVSSRSWKPALLPSIRFRSCFVSVAISSYGRLAGLKGTLQQYVNVEHADWKSTEYGGKTRASSTRATPFSLMLQPVVTEVVTS